MAKRVNKSVTSVKSIFKTVTARSTDRQITEAFTKEGTEVSAKGSSNIHSFSYDEETKILKITFIKGGREYEYFGVPRMVYEGMILAPSRGKYFHQFIRYKYKQAEL